MKTDRERLDHIYEAWKAFQDDHSLNMWVVDELQGDILDAVDEAMEGYKPEADNNEIHG